MSSKARFFGIEWVPVGEDIGMALHIFWTPSQRDAWVAEAQTDKPGRVGFRRPTRGPEEIRVYTPYHRIKDHTLEPIKFKYTQTEEEDQALRKASKRGNTSKIEGPIGDLARKLPKGMQQLAEIMKMTRANLSILAKGQLKNMPGKDKIHPLSRLMVRYGVSETLPKAVDYLTRFFAKKIVDAEERVKQARVEKRKINREKAAALKIKQADTSLLGEE